MSVRSSASDINSVYPLKSLRKDIRDNALADEGGVIARLIHLAQLSEGQRADISTLASRLVEEVRARKNPGMMEVFLAEYGLSTKEGVALMCLAEALLRVPDNLTIDALIEDKIAPSDWGAHLGKSTSPLVNASTWALLLTGKVLQEDEGIAGTLRNLVKRAGEPVIRTAVAQAMKELGAQFVLGQTITDALKRGKKQEQAGYTYSYDMLGEAARTESDARRYHLSYSEAIGAISKACVHDDIKRNPGISVKLSALHPRYEATQAQNVVPQLVGKTLSLALLAKSGGMGFNIDAEEADRLDISLEIIEKVLSDPALKGWDGFGVVVQAYGKRATYVIEWLITLAKKHQRKIMIRLVKGAYWDTEIKRAQTLGLSDFPVFTRKMTTDLSYISCARQLLSNTDCIYPQFATHNAHSVAAILELAKDLDKNRYEFQRLHGMGEALHDIVLDTKQTNCRIYAPVGAHEDLLAYLVRRLLENGANSSFVNQIVNKEISAAEIAQDPIEKVDTYKNEALNPAIDLPENIYGPSRKNARGWDVTDHSDQNDIGSSLKRFKDHQWQAEPILAEQSTGTSAKTPVFNPTLPDEIVGYVQQCDLIQVDDAYEIAKKSVKNWSDRPASQRADYLRTVADLYEENAGELFALANREAGKNWLDCVAELREAVDFLRYYANEAERIADKDGKLDGQGVFVCISPWNFPLAIYTGQIAAALVAGNAVLAKPAEQTPLIAHFAAQLFHQAGIPKDVLQFVPGEGRTIGSHLVSLKGLSGVCFTGSTNTAMLIHKELAQHGAADATLIAETGGLNAMIVDSSALLEQAVRDIVASSFQSAGQRCSALRILYVQEDIRDNLLRMLKGAMDALTIGDPASIATDVGPVIDVAAQRKIANHIEKAQTEGRVLHKLAVPDIGLFVSPSLVKVNSILDLEEEIFGPVLHVASYKASKLESVIKDINSAGYGLTFGLHTRIDDRVQYIVDRVKCGNIYVNRNQIGAIVGSQPFGGIGLSGTGPKAGGPHYVKQFTKINKGISSGHNLNDHQISLAELQSKVNDLARLPDEMISLSRLEMPGPTGEANILHTLPKGNILCLGPGDEAALKQQEIARKNGCSALAIVSTLTGSDQLVGTISPDVLTQIQNISAIAYWGVKPDLVNYRQAMAQRNGPILPIMTDAILSQSINEKHICIDVTAAGGNASLLDMSS